MYEHATIAAYEQAIHTAADTVRNAVGNAEIGIVLGSGLGGFVQELTDARSIGYKDIPGFPVSTAPGHAGQWWSGVLGGKRVYMLQGRIHAYEGYDLRDVTMYVRVMKLLGVHTLLLTNAAGCINLNWHAGDLMIMTDFINFSGKNPLTGPNLDSFGPRFPDMTHPYDPELIRLCKQQADILGLTNVREGVYMWFNGPCFESAAEIRMARIMGADAAGMSTVPETIVARHCGQRVLGITCMTNMAAGILDQPLTHEEVIVAADQAYASFSSLLSATVAAM